jgi:hypothetical protein
MSDPSPNTIHIALNEYGFAYPNAALGTKPFVDVLLSEQLFGYTLASTCPVTLGPCKLKETRAYPPGNDATVVNVYRMTLTTPVAGTVSVDTVDGTMMDWTKRLSRQALSNWSFTPPQLSAVCVQSSICPRVP